MLPGGDLTEIGEKGINLSGGQKSRISLARAVYADRNIILMDDPVSALDANVKRKVFEKVFMDALKGKTLVLVTHAVDFIDKADRIIVMESGKIKASGTYSELENNPDMKHVIETLTKKSQDEASETKDEENKKDKRQKLEEVKEELTQSHLSTEGTKITDEENDEIIDVGWDIYASFFLTRGTWIIYMIVFPLFVAYSYLIVYYTFGLGEWVQNSSVKHKFWNNFWIVVLSPIGYALIITTIFILVSFSTVRISRQLHEKMLEKVCKAPINLYFDKTPSGKILNRFSKDINKIDDSIAQ